MIPVYIFGFVLMGLLSGYLTFKIMSFSKTVDVPDLKGKTLVEANDLLKRNGLYLKVEGEEYDPVVASGRIVRQEIPAGNKVKEQRGVSVFLSRGPKVLSVPGLVGQSLHDAESVIAKSGLKVEKVIHVHSRTAEKDTVISQRPNPEEAMKDSFSLVVSMGPYDIIYYCPDFSGRSRDDAADLAEKLGLKIEFAGEGERVRSQKPKPNAQIKSGETIRLKLEGEPLIHG
ncbi:MAG TPA: PASTA domain-containing protein [Thermodesulfovibrionales bacterium]|nr:PASTA domain-containing protein [Thermodesulfovibrionales bacterium]